MLQVLPQQTQNNCLHMSTNSIAIPIIQQRTKIAVQRFKTKYIIPVSPKPTLSQLIWVRYILAGFLPTTQSNRENRQKVSDHVKYVYVSQNMLTREKTYANLYSKSCLPPTRNPYLCTSCTILCVFKKKASLSVLLVRVAACASTTFAICNKIHFFLSAPQ